MILWKKIVKKLKQGSWYPFYNSLYQKKEIESRLILLHFYGDEDSVLWEVLRELCSDRYSSWRLVLSVDRSKWKTVKVRMKKCGLRGYKVLKSDSLQFYACASGAGIIIADKPFHPRYIKKEGQVVFRFYNENLELTKRKAISRICSGNGMRNLLQSDYICFTDRRKEEEAAAFYCLTTLYKGMSLQRKDITPDGICRHLLCKDNQLLGQRWNGNGKENILIYGGDLTRNGITTALYSMLNGIDLEKFNYFLSFRENQVREQPDRLKDLPKAVHCFPIASEMNLDVLTGAALMSYLVLGVKKSQVRKRVAAAYEREWKKHFGGIRFRQVIQYNGYDAYVISLFRHAPCIRTIWVHSDTEKEIQIKKNRYQCLMQDAYREYDHVVLVSEVLRASIARICPDSKGIMVIENCHDYNRVLKRSEEAVCFQPETESTVSLNRLEQILKSNTEKFINIGRYCLEKGHERLIRAFEKYWRTHREAVLIIIGTYGELYRQTQKKAAKSEAADNIILIQYMENPMPVLKQCSLLILSSYFEGLGLVLLEADTLGVPVFSCDIAGPREFLSKYKGMLVEDSEDGILWGMEQYHRAGISILQINHQKRNQEALMKCKKMLEG